MPDSRKIRSISRRLNIELDHLSNPIRQRRLRWGVWCTVVPIVLMALAAVTGKWTIYWARPVASQHHSIGNDCGQCHSKHLQPIVALAGRFGLPGAAHASSVTDQDCQNCHREDTFDHNPVMVDHAIGGCVACHNEHRGQDALSLVADGNCTLCHGDLKTTDESSTFHSGITSLDTHPEFALLQTPTESGPAKGHAVHSVAELDQGTWRDKSQLYFNHETHLSDDGVLLPADHPDNGDGDQSRVLTCADCHLPDDRGEYMQPVVYEKHCQECHRLEVSESLLVGGELPHAAPGLLAGILRERLVAYAQTHPAEVSPPANATDVLPNKSTPTAPAPKDAWEWAERRLSSGDTFRSVTSACNLCHAKDANPTAGAIAALNIVAPQVPERWMPHSQFSHRRHEAVDCTECHEGVGDSSSATDILMTSIDTCRNCHASRNMVNSNRNVRTDCIQCHRYHNHLSGTDHRKPAAAD